MADQVQRGHRAAPTVAAIDSATIVRVQAWMGHADVQTTMKYMHHCSRAGDARLLSAAFVPTPDALRAAGPANQDRGA